MNETTISTASVLVEPRFSYLRLGRRNTPLDAGFGKDGAFAQERYPLTQIRAHAVSGGNLGVRTGKQSSCFVLDVDPRNGGEQSLATLVERHGALPPTYTVQSGGGGQHYYFRLPDFDVSSGTHALGPGLDVKGENSYVVAPGSVHAKTGRRYLVSNDAPIAQPPGWLVDLLRARHADKATRRRQQSARSVSASKVVQPEPCCEALARRALASIAKKMDELAVLPERGRLQIAGKPRGWDDGFFVLGVRLVEVAQWRFSSVTLEEVRELFFAHVPGDDGSFHPEHKWEDAENAASDWFRGAQHRAIDHVATLNRAADLSDRATQTLSDGGKSTFTDARLAYLFADRLAAQGAPVLYAQGVGWLRWDGRRWRPTDAGAIKGLVLDFALDWLSQLAAEDAPHELTDKVTALLSEPRAARLVRAMEALIRAEATDLDGHPDLLNCRNGVVDLRTGELRPHDPKLLLTKVTRVDYKPVARSEDWERAKQALEAGVREYVLSRLGQAVTGHTPSDDRIVFNIGVGGNGKSTLMDPVRLCLGNYAGTVPQKLLLANPNEHPAEFMTLRGLRVAVLEELPEQGRLNTQRLKTIAGTETITARGMRQNFIEFSATHALFVNTNHAPSVIETDHGTWRRLLPVSFERKFRAADGTVDETLRQRVRRRRVLEAVLADLVSHARRWYDNGRVMPPPPPAIERAAAAWRSESDDLVAYFDDRLQPDPEGAIRFSDLVEDFNEYLSQKGHRVPWSDKLLSTRLAANEGLPVRFEKGKRGRRYVDRRGGEARTRHPVTVWQGVRFR